MTSCMDLLPIVKAEQCAMFTTPSPIIAWRKAHLAVGVE